MERISDDFVVAGEDPPGDLISDIFPNLDAFGPNGDNEARLVFTWRSVLVPKNDYQRSFNEEITRRVPAEELESLSVDINVDKGISVIYPGEFLQTLTPAGIPTHRVVLKVSAPFMLLLTISPSRGLNGTRYLLTAASPWVLYLDIATKPSARQRAFVPRCRLTATMQAHFERGRASVRPYPAAVISCCNVYFHDHRQSPTRANACSKGWASSSAARCCHTGQGFV